jgi:hypothetical protein
MIRRSSRASPAGSYLIASDSPNLSALAHEAIHEDAPVVIVFPGREYMVMGGGDTREEALAVEFHLAVS